MEFCKICDPKSKYDDCICNENFKRFYDTYNSIKKMKNEYSCFNIEKQWSISTMTVCGSFNCVIDIEKYKQLFTVDINKKSFYNSVCINLGVKYQSKPRVSAKIFTNGNIQLAGILNVVSATYAIRKLFSRLCKNDLFKTGETLPFISNVRICMINSDFKINKNIKQSTFCQILDEEKFDIIKRYSFNPSNYPGINIKYASVETDSKANTCSIFRPGSIILTGGSELLEYKIFMEKIIYIFEKYNNVLY